MEAIYGWVLLVAGALLAIYSAGFFNKKPAKNERLVVLGLAMVFIAVLGFGWLGNAGFFAAAGTTAGVAPAAPSGSGLNCAQNPAYTYSAVDVIGGTGVIGGTDYIKQGTNYPVSSLAAPTAGESLSYWKSNTTVFASPVSGSVGCGVGSLQASAYPNGSVTLSVFDTPNNVILTSGGGVNNVSGAANAIVNAQIRYQPTALSAGAPFGGCMAVEYPNNMTSVVVPGLASGCPYKWTYPTRTGYTTTFFTLPVGFDAAGDGNMKTYNVQMRNGAVVTSGTAYIVTQPANYYLVTQGSQIGTFALDIEQTLNSATTKTFNGGATTTFVIKS